MVNGAQIHLKNVETNDAREAVSSGEATYKFDNLLAGRYQITAEASGFKTHVQSDMILRANIAATVNIALQVGTTQQKVEVTAEAVLLDTQTANNSVVMDSHLLAALPKATEIR